MPSPQIMIITMETKDIYQEVEFDATPNEVYELLMDSEKHAAFTGSPANIGKNVGDKFTCYGEYIEGENLELEQDKKIVQSWKGHDFPEGHYSTVTFELEERNGKTILKLTHKGVPEDKKEHLDHGWKKMYWEKMKKYLSENKE